ncbi:Phage integrase family protein [Clostridium sp. C105KSO13]|nr:Phage integrase family protein [Clostridium sp. C105KSO13]
MLALTLKDTDFTENKISITKTRYRVAGKHLTNPPKTGSGERVVDIPEFLTEEIKEYISHLYKPGPEQLFEITADQLRRVMLRRIQQAGVKQIRVHDLRHSHASLLNNLGGEPGIAC